MTPAKLKKLGFEPVSGRCRIGDELLQFWRFGEDQFTVIWKPKFVLRPHRHGEFGDSFTESDLDHHGWPPPEPEPQPQPQPQQQPKPQQATLF